MKSFKEGRGGEFIKRKRENDGGVGREQNAHQYEGTNHQKKKKPHSAPQRLDSIVHKKKGYGKGYIGTLTLI